MAACAVSMLRWLADDHTTPELKPATYTTPEVRLTHREMQLTFFLIEVLLPLSVMVLGVGGVATPPVTGSVASFVGLAGPSS